MSNNKLRYTFAALWVGIPFVIGAALEFAPIWVSYPATFILGLYWIGTWMVLGKTEEKSPNA